MDVDRDHRAKVTRRAQALLTQQLIAPLIAPLLAAFTCTLLMSPWLSFQSARDVLNFALLVSAVAVPVTLFVGMPWHAFAYARHWRGLAAYVAPSLVVGVALGTVLGALVLPARQIIVSAGLVGALTGCFFWLIRRPDRDPRLQEQDTAPVLYSPHPRSLPRQAALLLLALVLWAPLAGAAALFFINGLGSHGAFTEPLETAIPSVTRALGEGFQFGLRATPFLSIGPALAVFAARRWAPKLPDAAAGVIGAMPGLLLFIACIMIEPLDPLLSGIVPFMLVVLILSGAFSGFLVSALRPRATPPTSPP